MGEFVLGVFCGAIIAVVVMALCKVIPAEDDNEE